MIRYLISQSALIRLIVFVIFLFGGYTYAVLMPRESSPDIKIPVVMVTTAYLGVSPQDIEKLVTTPLENELASLKDIKKMASSSVEGASIVSLEFEPNVVIEDALQQVRDRVNKAKSKLPDDAEDPDINEISFSSFPVVILTLAGPVHEDLLKKLGKSIAEDAQKITGVLDAVVTGGREREIRVQVDPYRLAALGLSLDDVIGAIKSENVNIPGGDVATGDARFLLRVPGDVIKPSDLEVVAIKRVGDRPVLLRDIARVVDDYEDRKSYARMNGESAVSVGVSKRSGANILSVVQSFKHLVDERSKTPDWPKEVQYRFLGDQSKVIEDMVSELENGVLSALVLVVAVLMFTMGMRNSLFVAFSIPVSMLLGAIVLSMLGFTLNMIVLFSLILVLGMLVDNGIVVVENIYRHLEMGKSLLDASVDGAKEVAMAVTSSTATTVVAFIPLVFWSGITGEFMSYMPKTVIIQLVASLFAAVCVLPVLTARWMRMAPVHEGYVKVPSVWKQRYQTMLEWSIDHRYLSAGIGFSALVLTFILYGFFNAGVEFFADTEPNRATVALRAPDGTDLEATDRMVRQIEALLLAEKNVDVYVAETGVSGGTDPMVATQSAVNVARLTVDFLPDHNTVKKGETERSEKPSVTIERLRGQMASIVGAEIAIEKERMGPPVGADIAIEVSGEHFDEVGETAAGLRRQLLSQIKGIAELSDDYRVGRPELRMRIDRARAKRVGASTQSAASSLRTAVAGTVASTLRDGDDEYDISVEVMPEFRDNLQAILALRIPGRIDTRPETFQVPLSSIASYTLAGGSGTIRHVEQDLVVTIKGNVKEGQNPNEVRAAVGQFLGKQKWPVGISARMGGAQDEQDETAQFLSRAFVVAVFLILVVLVAQFNRFDVPLIILASVILSLMGVLWGLMLTRTPFGIMMTGLGVISLAGVVVNNAIVLLDYVQQLEARGMAVRDALIEAGLTRLRPVLLTAVTTILGLIPMGIGVSFDFKQWKWIVGSPSAAWWAPMAIAVIFGMAVATVLTLVMVPTLYSIMDDLRRKKFVKLFR